MAANEITISPFAQLVKKLSGNKVQAAVIPAEVKEGELSKQDEERSLDAIEKMEQAREVNVQKRTLFNNKAIELYRKMKNADWQSLNPHKPQNELVTLLKLLREYKQAFAEEQRATFLAMALSPERIGRIPGATRQESRDYAGALNWLKQNAIKIEVIDTKPKDPNEGMEVNALITPAGLFYRELLKELKKPDSPMITFNEEFLELERTLANIIRETVTEADGFNIVKYGKQLLEALAKYFSEGQTTPHKQLSSPK